jgi:hypothetical protein
MRYDRVTEATFLEIGGQGIFFCRKLRIDRSWCERLIATGFGGHYATGQVLSPKWQFFFEDMRIRLIWWCRQMHCGRVMAVQLTPHWQTPAAATK